LSALAAGSSVLGRTPRLDALKAQPRKPGEASFFFYDAHFKNEAVKVLPGEYYCDTEDILVLTTLGSCIAACLWTGRPGRRHEPLHAARRRRRLGPLRLLRDGTADQRDDEARRLAPDDGGQVFGGGAVISGMNSINVGERNTEFVLSFLATERIPVVSKDVLDIYPRKVCYLPASGKAMVKRLAPTNAEALIAQDRAAAQKAAPANTGGGSIDLF
jgi:chemotaxis protein CheD